MTILDVQLGYSKNTGGWESTEDGKSISAKFSELWQVTHTHDATDPEILSDSRLPQKNSTKTGTSVPCIAGKITQRGVIYTLVQVDYAKTVQISDASGNNVDWSASPLSQPPIISWSDEVSNEPIDQDADGNPICTANLEPITGVTMELADPVVTITRNFAVWNPHVTHQYRHSVNSDTFLSFPAGTARLVSATAELVIDPQYGPYWKVTARIKFRYPYNTTSEKAWYARVRHEGFDVRLTPLGGIYQARENATDNTGSKVSTPVLLDADGVRITDPSDAIWLEFKRYYPLPYASLGLLD